MDLSKYTKPQLDKMRELMNLTDEEEKVYILLAKKKTIVEISDKTSLSESTVSRRIKSIKSKMDKIQMQTESDGRTVRLIQNGRIVSPEEIRLTEKIVELIANNLKN